MPSIPHDSRLDSTLALEKDPYRFISDQCRHFGTDLFQARILLQETICMTGPQAAELFYTPERFARHGAAPGRIQKSLFGKGGVQGLDGEAHRHRKQMFMSLMAPERIQCLGEMSRRDWERYARRWSSMNEVVLYRELQQMLTETVCAWAGVPLDPSEAELRSHQLTALFDYAGSVGPKHWWARTARKIANRWIKSVIEDIRGRKIQPPEESAASVIAWHRDLHGNLLSARDAAVELINVLRPTIAESVYITFVAHALHAHPECASKIIETDGEYVESFAQEVRRFYPFFPSALALVRKNFDWNGYAFPEGTRVMLDLYGTDHDERAWDLPESFRPERFIKRNVSPFEFVPQGGGDHHQNHRCPGEWISLELMKVAAKFLAGRMRYQMVPGQDLSIALSRLPAIPESGFVISNVEAGF